MFPRGRPVYGFTFVIIAQCQSFAKCEMLVVVSFWMYFPNEIRSLSINFSSIRTE